MAAKPTNIKRAGKPLPTAKPAGKKELLSKAKPKKTLNDYLKAGKRPPVKGPKAPPDYDVVIKGYNDKKTTGRK